MKQIGRELGVRYVVEGSVRKADRRVRVTCQMIDATTGAHVWADRFDRNSDDIFALQDDIACPPSAPWRRACGAPRSSG